MQDDDVPRHLHDHLAEFFLSPLLYHRYLDEEKTELREDYALVMQDLLLGNAGATFRKVLDNTGAVVSMKDRHKQMHIQGRGDDYLSPRMTRLCAVFHSTLSSHYYMLGTLLDTGKPTPLGKGYTGLHYANMVLSKHHQKIRSDFDSMGLLPGEILKKLNVFLNLHPQAFEINYQLTTLDLNMQADINRGRQDPTYAFALIMDMPQRYVASVRNTIVELMHAAFGKELARFVNYEVYAYDIDNHFVSWMADQEHLVLNKN